MNLSQDSILILTFFVKLFEAADNVDVIDLLLTTCG